MFTLAARRMGYRVHTYSPNTDTPTCQVADTEIVGAYEDLDAVRAFARAVSAVTFEFENVPVATAAACAEVAPVRPAGEILHTTQHRLREKRFLQRHGFPVAPFTPVDSEKDLQSAIGEMGAPAVLKTAGFGYDGKGQVTIHSPEQAAGAWKLLTSAHPRRDGNEPLAVLEGFVDFEREVSVIAARGQDGAFAYYGPVENHHEHHILDVTTAPAALPPHLADEAAAIARAVVETLEVVGVLCVEFFLTRAGAWVINELAPRPHNSGHYTCDATVTSQFEQQLRAVCGLPLGSVRMLQPAAACANLLGDLWTHHEPNWAAALAIPGIKLHLYGKHTPKPGRKMGHLTALANTPEEAAAIVRRAREALGIRMKDEG
jgi:5-(carboxyamino)imidazole ribonucleotide synthase